MNVNDFTQHQANFIYPVTGGTPSVFQTHAEWLEAGALRYKINVAMHGLSIEQLKDLLLTVTHPEAFADSGEK